MSETTAQVDKAPADTTDADSTAEAGTPTNEATDSTTTDEASADDWRKGFDPERAMEKIRKQNSELKGLRERAKTAEEKASEAEQAKEQIPALEAKALRFEVALDLGLPKELAKRLTGNTREELVADAEELLRLVSTPKPTTRKPIEALRGGGEPEREPEETDLDKVASRMFRR